MSTDFIVTGDISLNGNINNSPVSRKVLRLSENIAGGVNLADGFCFIDGDNNVRVIGANNSSRFWTGASKDNPCGTLWLPSGKTASKVYAFRDNIFILTTDGYVYATGRNDFAQCGIGGTSTNINYPTAIYSDITTGQTVTKVIMSSDVDQVGATMFLTSTGNVYSCGKNARGQLGTQNTTDTSSVVGKNPTLTLGPGNGLSHPTTAVSDVIGLGGSSASWNETFCALLSDGTVYCVGYGIDGQMGNGADSSSSTWVQVIKTDDNPLTGITNIYGCGRTGGNSLYALDSSGNLYAWGYNIQGQLGTGDTNNKNKANLVSTGVLDVYASSTDRGSVIIKKASNTFYATGYNGQGNLGLGDTTVRSSFTEITSLNGLSIDTIYYGNTYGAASFFAYNSTSNILYASGDNGYGQLGLYDSSDRNTFTLVPLNLPSNISDLKLYHTNAVGVFSMILTEEGKIYFAGQSRYGIGNKVDANIPAFGDVSSFLAG